MSLNLDVQSVDFIDVMPPTKYGKGKDAWFTQKIHIRTHYGEALTITLFADDKTVLLNWKG